jgi:hypothetical protein
MTKKTKKQEIVANALPRLEHARRISAALLKGVESAMEAGQHLAVAQNELTRPDFLAMLKEDLSISEGTASKLMSIASHPVLSELSIRKALPVDWTTLYALTKIPQTSLRSAIEDGKVHPGMGAKNVRALLPQPEPEEQRDDDLPSDYEGSSAPAPDETTKPDGGEPNPVTVAWVGASSEERRDFVHACWDEILRAHDQPPPAKKNGNAGVDHWAEVSKENSEQLDRWIESDK